MASEHGSIPDIGDPYILCDDCRGVAIGTERLAREQTEWEVAVTYSENP